MYNWEKRPLACFWRLLLLLLLLLEKTNLSCCMQASRTGYKVNRCSTRKYRGQCSYRLYDWLNSWVFKCFLISCYFTLPYLVIMVQLHFIIILLVWINRSATKSWGDIWEFHSARRVVFVIVDCAKYDHFVHHVCENFMM